MSKYYKPEKDWLWEWERQAHPIVIFQLAKVWTRDKTWPWLHMPVKFISRGAAVNMYISSAILRKGQYLAQLIQKSSSFLHDYKNKAEQDKKALSQYQKKLVNCKFKELSNVKLIALLNEYSKIYRQHCVVVIRVLNRIGPEIVRKYLEGKYGDEETAKMLPVLYAANKESVELKSEKDLLEIAKKIGNIKKLRNNKKVEPLIKSYLRKYQWLMCGYAGERPLSETKLLKQLRIMLSDKFAPALRIKQISKGLNDKKEKRKLLFRKLKLPVIYTNLINAISEFTYYKDYLRMNYNKLHFAERPMMYEIAKRFGVSWFDLRHLSVPEMIRFLKNGKINRQVIRDRKRNYVCYTKGKKISFITGQAASALEKKIIPSSAEQTQIVKGTSASLGKAKGIVKVVKHYMSEKEFPKNTVLITPMTTPELVPLAKKAVAIVTDEGGITCHAAIISRELKIPCVIGTKNATHVFKDGDKVEVNADKGIVRKVSKKGCQNKKINIRL